MNFTSIYKNRSIAPELRLYIHVYRKALYFVLGVGGGVPLYIKLHFSVLTLQVI